MESLPKLSHLDLVLLDYSVNDACMMWDGKDSMAMNEMEHGMEWLIRRILLLYSRIRPQLVILNGMPAMFHDGGYQYTTAYEKLARHYSIPLWSYDSVAQSASMMNKSFSKTLQWKDICKQCGIHPPWIVHLYTSDLYAAIIEKEFNRCPSSSPPSHTSSPENENNTKALLVLPAPLTGYGSLHLCELDSPRHLDINAVDVVRNHSHKHIGRYSGGWRAVEERIQMFGWVDEFHNSNNSSSPPRSMFFKLQESDHLYQLKKDLLLRIALLKKYNNTGQFDVYLCGMFLQSVDTCWGDPKIKRSTTELHFIPLSGGVPAGCNNDPSPTIEFRHVRVDGSANKTREAGCERGFEKVSVIYVSVCYAL